MQITQVITNVDLKLKNGSTESLFCYTECLDYPEEYYYLEDVPITTSTDICLAICAGCDIGNLDEEWQKEVILPMFLFYKGKMTFEKFLEKLHEIDQNIDSDDEILYEIIDQLECIEDDDWETEDDLIKWSRNIISDILEKPLLNEDAVKEIKVPDVPIPASDIECIIWTSYDYCQIRYIDWCSEEDYQEFRSDSQHAEPGTPHFKYLLTKWTDYKNKWAPGGSPYDPLGCGEECSVDEAIRSGDIDKLTTEWWYNEKEDIFYINHNTPSEPEEQESLKPYESPAESNDNKTDYDIYTLLKECIDGNDPEMIRSKIGLLDIPESFMEFWHIGIMHDAISSDSAEITANLLNSGKLRFTDEELEYLIDYAIESGKTEHTACLLNYKNDNQ